MADSSLLVHAGPGAGSEHPVDGEMILGRERASADLVIPDPGVSRRHARVIPDNGGVILEDLGSSNGTYLNGRRIARPVEVTAGDEVQLGATVVEVRASAPTAPMRGQARRGPSPRRLAPHPRAQTNVPAFSAAFLGPLSILLVFLGAGGFFIALPCGIAAIALGNIGSRMAERKRAGHRALARIGRFTGFVGAAISGVAAVVVIAAAAIG